MLPSFNRAVKSYIAEIAREKLFKTRALHSSPSWGSICAVAKPRKTTPAAKVPALIAKLVPIDSIKADPNNAREHNDRSIDGLVASLKRWGQQKPIVIDKDGIIKAGSGTWSAARKLGWSEINVVQTSLPAKEAERYAVADNRLGDLSYFDDDLLAGMLDGLGAEDLASLGFDQAEADELISMRGDPLEAVTKSASKSQGNNGQACVRLMIIVKNVALIEDALTATGEMNREKALLAICEAYLENAERQLNA